MPFAATWMDLEIIILSEISQTNIISYCLIDDKGSRGQVPVESGEQGQGDLDNGWQCKKKLFPMDLVEPG